MECKEVVWTGCINLGSSHIRIRVMTVSKMGWEYVQSGKNGKKRGSKSVLEAKTIITSDQIEEDELVKEIERQ